MAESALRTEGASNPEARRRAARLLGNDTLAREDARRVWIAIWIEQAIQDLRYAVRTLRRDWIFTIGSSFTLALGIGVLAGVFAVFNSIYLQPWPVRDPGHVFGISVAPINPPRLGEPRARRVSYVVWDQIRGDLASATLAARYAFTALLHVQEKDSGTSARIAFVDEGFLQTVGIEFEHGSLPALSGVPALAVTDRAWRMLLGSDPAVIGRTVWIGARPAVITGVLEKRFVGFAPEEVVGVMLLKQTHTWIVSGGASVSDFLTNPSTCCVEVVGRLKGGYTRAQAGQEIESRINAAHASFKLPPIRVTPWETTMAGSGAVKNTVPRLFALLFTGCGIVTLLACANIGNLQLARGMRRMREVSIRLSLGAARGRVVRQFVTEGAALSAIGIVGGLLFTWTIPRLVLSMDRGSSMLGTPDRTVVAFAASVGALATLLFSLVPALRVTRIDWRGPTARATPGAGLLRGLLLAAQIALSLALVTSASLLSRGAFRAATGADVGFEASETYAFSTSLQADRFESTQGAREELNRTLRADSRWALADDQPLRGHMPVADVSIRGVIESTIAQPVGLNRKAVALLRLPLRTGRWPVDDGSLDEAVVTESLADSLWNTTDVIGRTFSAKSQIPLNRDTEFTVVGTMGEVRMQDTTARPAFVTALRRDSTPVILGPSSLAPEIRALFARAHPDIKVRSQSLLAGLRETMKNTFVGISVASGIAIVALLLASVGVFGVFAYLVEERRREIGVRLALGASKSQIWRSVVVMAGRPAVSGFLVGLALAIAAGFVLRRNLFGLSPLDPLAYLAVGGILGVAALAATYIPIRRALRVDPAVALRQE
jgi:predicted permease